MRRLDVIGEDGGLVGGARRQPVGKILVVEPDGRGRKCIGFAPLTIPKPSILRGGGIDLSQAVQAVSATTAKASRGHARQGRFAGWASERLRPYIVY